MYEEIAQLREAMTLGGREVNVRAYVAAFNLKGQMQEKLVGKLSGGEHGAEAMRRRAAAVPAP